jgi:hypothetical protein
MDAVPLVILTAYRDPIDESSVEAGFERFQRITGGAVDYGSFRFAIDTCLRDGLIRDPVRLEAGALQCHWRLDLTPKGVATARALIG